MLNNPYLIAIVIPLALLAAGALLRKIVRGGGWRRTDFFLGAELTLAAIGSAMVYLYDLREATSETQVERWSDVAATASFMGISFFLLLFIMSTHQDWEQRSANPRGQLLWLGLLCNAIGIGLFSSFVLLVKGV